jgi:hypothetical protein
MAFSSSRLALIASFVVGCSGPSSINHGGTPGSGGSGGSTGGNGAQDGGSNGGGGSGGTGGAGGGGYDGGIDDGCSDAAKLIYVIDDNGTFSSFKPNLQDVTKSVFTDLGMLNCNAPSGYQPFSMSVDRNAVAWVEYVDQGIGGLLGGSPNKIYQVDTTKLTCTDSGFTGGQSGFEQFGMGFVSNAAGSTDETLFVAGSSMVGSSTTLGTLDTMKLTVTSTGGMLTGDPELTGTGAGELWAFFPDKSNPRVSKLDKMSGAESSPIALGSNVAGNAASWAFGFYGGDFFVFLAKQTGGGTGMGATTVYHVTTGGLKDQLDTMTRHIVGAGVSTCAPVVPPPIS